MPHAVLQRRSKRSSTWASALLRAAMLGVVMASAACSTRVPQAPPAALTFVVVRHAEKGSDQAHDPSLSEAGRARAQQLAEAMAGMPPTAVYATQFRRTLQTAQPTALASGVPVRLYEAQLPAADVARQLRDSHTEGVILVVGHSNTVPDIVAALSGQTVPPMPDEEYGVLYRIDLGAGNDAVVARSGF